PSFNQKPNYSVMAGQRGLMNRCRMGMEPHWVVPVWIFARIKQRSNDLNVAKLRCQGKRPVAIHIAGPWKQWKYGFGLSQCGGQGQIKPGPSPDQSVHCLK